MFNNKNTAVVLTDPQVEFLKPAGGGFGLTKDILEKYNTIENMIEMVKQAKEKGYKLFISPHYFGSLSIRTDGLYKIKSGSE